MDHLVVEHATASSVELCLERDLLMGVRMITTSECFPAPLISHVCHALD